MNTEMPDILSYSDIQQALERCMAAEPVAGAEYALSKDASRLADILGEMIYRKADTLAVADVSEKAQAAFNRWKVAP